MIIAIVILAALLLIFISILVFLWRLGVVRRKEKPLSAGGRRASRSSWSAFIPQIIEGQEWFLSKEPERVTTRSDEGFELVGYYLPAEENGKRTMLMVHGFRAGSNSDFACALRFYHEMGFNLLVIHQRAHGESGGKYICYGVKERFDVLRWTEFINTKTPNQDIFLNGISMGAATVLMALGLYLPANVRGCIADCGYTSPREEFCHVIKRWYRLPPKPFVDILCFFAKAIAGADFGISATEAVKRAAVPVLFIHGGKDKLVPPWMGETNFWACASEKQFVVVPEAGHLVSFLVEPERVQRQIKNFLGRYSR